jgi:hypothetical protein
MISGPQRAVFVSGMSLILFSLVRFAKESSVSHIVQIQTEIRDPAAIRTACNRLQLPPPVLGEFQLYSNTASGWAVQLRNWRYPVVCDVNSSKLAFDDFEGRWGDRQELDRFLQGYAVEKAKLEARKQGHTVREHPLKDGSIKLTVQVGGAG